MSRAGTTARERELPGFTCARMLRIAIAVAVVLVSQLQVGTALAANPVTDLTVTQSEGYATLAWTPVAGASDYQVERTVVNADGSLGTATIVGVWQAQRTITPAFPKFADAGFALGGTLPMARPCPLRDDTPGLTRPRSCRRHGRNGAPAPAPRCGRSGRRAATRRTPRTRTSSSTPRRSMLPAIACAWSSSAARIRWRAALRPPATARSTCSSSAGRPTSPRCRPRKRSRTSPAIAFNCNVHGDEPQGRESCFIFARMLAFTDDPHLLEILRSTTVLIVPSINGNGRAANTRGNETGADLNRDHAELLQPETKAFAAMLRDYTPEVGIDLHEGDNEDLPILTARHLNVYEPLFSEGKLGLVEGWLYEHAAANGWWHGPYSSGGDSHEGILRNTFALKNAIGLLAENRASGGATRPAEGTNLANRNRKSYGSLYEEFTMLEYYWARRAQIHQLVEESIAFNTSNAGRVVTRGSYPWPYNPLNGANTGLPDVDALNPIRSIDPAPCGYFLTEAQYSGPMTGGTAGLRLGIHGIAQETRPSGHIVRLAQPLRGLIPTVLDGAAVAPEPIVAGTRLFECPFVTAAPRSFALAAVEETQTVEQLTIGNTAAELDEPLNWTITEAASDCASPSDVPWLSTDQASGSTLSGGGETSTVAVTVSATGLLGADEAVRRPVPPQQRRGRALITIPVTFQVQYSFTGFFSPIENPPALNSANGGSAVPVKFVVAGDSGLSIVLGGSPASQQIDCETRLPLGSPEPISTPGSSGFVFRARGVGVPGQLEDREGVGRHLPAAERVAGRRDAVRRVLQLPLGAGACGERPGPWRSPRVQWPRDTGEKGQHVDTRRSQGRASTRRGPLDFVRRFSFHRWGATGRE